MICVKRIGVTSKCSCGKGGNFVRATTCAASVVMKAKTGKNARASANARSVARRIVGRKGQEMTSRNQLPAGVDRQELIEALDTPGTPISDEQLHQLIDERSDRESVIIAGEDDSLESWLAVNGIDEEDRPSEHLREIPEVDAES